VAHIDHFGNVISSIGKLSWLDEHHLELDPVWHSDFPPQRFAAAATNTTIHSHTIHGLSHAYHEAAQGEILAQIDSNGFLEIAANHDNAAERLDVQLGDKVMLKLQVQ
jgi:S-adenosylmethionine hydrolase